MATETVERRAAHRRGLKVTAIASLAGIAAGAATPSIASSATETSALAAPLLALVVGIGVMRAVGVDVGDFSTKDQLYVGFMTFALWFITWTIFLSTNSTPF